MAIVVRTKNSQELLTLIKNAIDNEEVKTWSYDEQGDFTHTPHQWANWAWLKPEIGTNELRFDIIGRNDCDLTIYMYGLYHGRFTEMLLEHFSRSFTSIRVTTPKIVPPVFS